MPSRRQTGASRLSSVFHSLQRLPTEPVFDPKATSLQIIPLRRSIRPCGIQRHVVPQVADVTRACDCGSESDHAPPASFSAAFRYRSRKASAWPIGPHVFPKERPLRPISNALGILLTLRSFNLGLQGEDELSPVFTARLPFTKRPPRQIYGRGIDRQI